MIDLDINKYKKWIKILLLITFPVWALLSIIYLFLFPFWEAWKDIRNSISEFVDKDIPDYIHLNKLTDIFRFKRRDD